MFRTDAILIYEAGFRLVALVDPGLANYYRSLIPRSVLTQGPRWAPHVTVVRSEKETPVYKEHWGKYDHEVLQLTYDPFIQIDPTYCWLNVWCDRLAQIREELGLPPKSRWTEPPSGGHQCFHLTIANRKL